MQTLQHGDVRLAYRARGAGETALLLHGSAGSGAMWRSAGRMLEQRYRVVAPDLIGYGRSSCWPGGRAFRLEEETAPLEHLVPAREPLHLVGYSYGGALALAMALANPRRLASLTLVEPGPFCILEQLGEGTAFGELLRMRRSFARRVGDGELAAAVGGFVDYWCGAGSWDALDEQARPQLIAAAPAIALNMQASFGARFDTQAIARLDTPTMLIFGGRSPAPIRRLTRVIAGLIGGSELAGIDDAGHMLPQTHAAQVNALVVRHVMAQGRAAYRGGIRGLMP